MAVKNTRDKINKELTNDTSHISTGKKGIANARTKATIKEILKHGTPDWFTHPEDYKGFAKEEYRRTKENSNKLVSSYKLPDQDILTDEKPRMTGLMSLDKFMDKLRENGLPKSWCV